VLEPKPKTFQIDFLDHVAIRVKDLEVSAKWYQGVLGLKRYQLDAWGPFPIFMLAGRSGLALFPAITDDTPLDNRSRNVKIDHFAFNVSRENFEAAKQHYLDLNLDFDFQDHTYFHSIYTKDPDGHTVELTTLVADPSTFYESIE
jgi:catechol 2,3-dioxygenase-like lactoylglutathione lyase family enzyme